MSGIAGIWDPSGVNEHDARGIVASMANAIRHRGPDDGGDWIDPRAGIALGARRLATLDLTPLAAQPMHSSDGRYVIACDGAIYNCQELRTELAAGGAAFRGRSDTEVLLAAIATWGVRRALERCNGMFAFVAWDRETRSLHLARDRAGEKPLYYGWAGNTLLFGSELKALRAHPACPGDLNRTALAAFFQHGYVPGPLSIYRGIYKLPPGSLLTLSAEHGFRGAPVPYWTMDEAAEEGVAHPFRGTADDALAALDLLLRDAVRIRLESAVPLGAFLSGVDSSLVVALMQAQTHRPVRTFTIGFHESRDDEAECAKAVARHLGTEHTELYVTPEQARAVIPRLPTLFDEPFSDTSQIRAALACDLARQSVTVSLSGDAGDELFGGYRRHQLGPSIWRGIRWMPAGLRRGVARLLALSPDAPGAVGRSINRLARRWTGTRSLTERLRQTADIIATRSPAELYECLMTYWKQSPSAHGRLLSAGDCAVGPHLGRNATHIMMSLDATGYLPDDILVKVDRATMAAGLETRLPLLDPRVIDFAWRLPLKLKIRGGEGKWLLRRLLYRYVPRELVSRPRRRFGMPIAEWLRGPLRDWAEALLDPVRIRREGLLDPAPIRRKWTEHLTGETRWGYQLWSVLMFQAWVEAQRKPEALARSA